MFKRCFLRLFHCRTRRRETRNVIARGQIMHYELKYLLLAGVRVARRLGHPSCYRRSSR
jgi:hypothetical protein